MEIDHAVLAAFGMKELERTHATETAHKRVDHHLRKRRRQGRIEGVAARGQYFRTDIRRPRLRAYDDPFHDLPPRFSASVHHQP